MNVRMVALSVVPAIAVPISITFIGPIRPISTSLRLDSMSLGQSETLERIRPSELPTRSLGPPPSRSPVVPFPNEFPGREVGRVGEIQAPSRLPHSKIPATHLELLSLTVNRLGPRQGNGRGDNASLVRGMFDGHEGSPFDAQTHIPAVTSARELDREHLERLRLLLLRRREAREGLRGESVEEPEAEPQD